MGTLFFELNDEGSIEVVPSDDLDSVSWQSVVRFWQPGRYEPLEQRRFSTSPEEFLDKASWLQKVWLPQGLLVEISPAVATAARSSKAGLDQFRRLATLDPFRHRNQPLEVPGLDSSYSLTQEQVENVLCLLDMTNGANFSVPGSGKTLTTLSVWKILQAEASVGKLLVVSPRAAFEAWSVDLEKFFNQTGVVFHYVGNLIPTEAQLVNVNYEQLENPDKLSYLSSWLGASKGMLVLDEAHRVKGGHGSVRWRAAKTLSLKASRTEVLTGTPMPQGPRDLQAIYSVAWPKLPRKALDENVLVRLTRKTAFVRTTKNELQIPAATLLIVKEEPTHLQKQILEAMNDQYSGLFSVSIPDRKNLAKRGRAVMSLLAAATNPGLLQAKSFSEIELGFTWPPKAVSDNADLMSLVAEFTHLEMPWKFKYVALRAEELRRQGKKLLVWTSFVGNIAGLQRVLKDFNPAVVFGGTAVEERDAQLHRFRSDPRCTVLISNPQTLGEGISLHQVCNTEIFVDRTYNAGLYLQAVDRIHRLGLAKNQETKIEILQTSGSIDERVNSRLAIKIRALATFLEDPHLVPASLPQDDALNPVDLLGLSDDDFDDLMNTNAQ